jgi:AraC-like DNA-binding protein
VVEVAALVMSREGLARLRDGLRAVAPLRPVLTCRDLVAAVHGGLVGGAVVELRDAEGTPVAPTVRRLREGFPLVPILAYVSLERTDGRDLLEIANAGVSALIVRGMDDVGVALRGALASAQDDATARRAMAELAPAIPEPARVVVEYCLAHARQGPTVADIARALGMHRKTLCSRLVRAGLPSPQGVIGWCRLIHAAHMMEDVSRPLEHIALQLNFSSAASLRNMLARYTGLRPCEVRQNGGFDCVLHALRRSLATRPMTPDTAVRPRRRAEVRRQSAARRAGR